jgi:HEAT repeat protein
MNPDLSFLINSLRSDDAAKRQAAAERLAQLGTDAQEAAVPLVEVCDCDESIREWAVAALEGLGPPRPADIGPLVELLKRPTLDTAYWAATLLGRLEDQAAPAVSGLVRALESHGELAVRQRAAWALAQIGPAACAARAALEAAAGSSDARLASLAVLALGRIGN